MGQEKASLIGYGSRQATNSTYDVASISLGRLNDNSPIKLEAYVVTRLNPIHMEGAAKFARKLKQKGVELADWRLYNAKSDIVTFDILIGSDYEFKILSPYKCAVQWLGMFLKIDHFRQVPFV